MGPRLPTAAPKGPSCLSHLPASSACRLGLSPRPLAQDAAVNFLLLLLQLPGSPRAATALGSELLSPRSLKPSRGGARSPTPRANHSHPSEVVPRRVGSSTRDDPSTPTVHGDWLPPAEEATEAQKGQAGLPRLRDPKG